MNDQIEPMFKMILNRHTGMVTRHIPVEYNEFDDYNKNVYVRTKKEWCNCSPDDMDPHTAENLPDSGKNIHGFCRKCTGKIDFDQNLKYDQAYGYSGFDEYYDDPGEDCPDDDPGYYE